MDKNASSEVWPPPIYSDLPPPDKPENDPLKTACHHATLGRIFVLLSLLAPPVFLPYALYYGWQAWRKGKIRQGAHIFWSATLLTIALPVIFYCWLKGK